MRPGLLHAWVLLTKMYVKLCLFDEAQQAFSKGYKLIQSFGSGQTELKEILDQVSLQILAESSKEENWQAAIKGYNEVHIQLSLDSKS